MKTIIEPERVAEVLATYQGATAKLWMFHISLRRFAIRLYWPGSLTAVYLVAIGCQRIRGDFGWSDARLVIVERDGRCVVEDPAAGFELVCDGVTVAEESPPGVDESFRGFLEPPP